MRKLTFAIFLLLLSISAFADSLTLSFDLPDFQLKETNYNGTNYTQIHITGGSCAINPGMPELPKMTFLLAMDNDSDITIKIQNIEFYDTVITPLIPSVTPSKKGIQIREVSKDYFQDVFIPESVVTSGGSYLQKSVFYKILNISPFQYNATTNVLRIIKHIDYSIISKGSLDFPSNYSSSLYNKGSFLNYKPSRLKSATLDENLLKKLLIICHESLLESMQDFVSWKRQKGFIVELVSTAILPTSELIKSYIATRYQQNAVDFVLLVGDAEQIPTIELSTGTSDQAYVYLEGDDSYPELPIGRFSGKTKEQILTIAGKVIETEKTTAQISLGHNSYMLVGSEEGIGDDNQYDYEHLLAIESRLLQNGYHPGFTLFDGTHGTRDLPGNPSYINFANALNSNVGLLFYTGHGDTDILTTTGFRDIDTNLLDNNTMPIGMFAGCQIGNFDFKNSLSEAFLLSKKNGTSAGLVAAMASTEDQWWDPPMFAQDRFVDFIISPSIKKKPNIGLLFLNSLIEMNNAYDEYAFETTDNWVLFGDPTMQIITDSIEGMTITSTAILSIGDSTVTITSDVDSAIVCITQNDSLLALSYLSAGENIIHFPFLKSTNPLKVTTSALNREYVQNEIIVSQGDTAFISISDIDYSNQNSETEFFYNDTILCSLELTNITSYTGKDIHLSVSSNSGVVFSKSEFDLDEIAPNGIISLSNLFSFTIPQNTIVRTVLLSYTLEYAGKEYTFTSEITIHYPKIIIAKVETSPTDFSNSDKYHEAGEIMLFTFYLENLSIEPTYLHDFEITGTDFVQLVSPSSNIIIESGTTISLDFLIGIPADLPQNTNILLNCSYTADMFSSDTVLIIKSKPFIEDWESQTTTTFEWENNVNNWIISDTSFQGSFSAKSADISDNDSSELSISLNVLMNDTISFYAKVSSEESYDELYFYVDGTQRFVFSGEKSWAQFSFPVSKGFHNFSWIFKKDYELSEGEDCAWLDNIVFPVIENNSPVNNIEITNSSDIQIYSSKNFLIPIMTNKTESVMFNYLNKPDWLYITDNGNGTATFSGTPPQNQNNDTVQFLLAAKQGNTNTYKIFTFYIEGSLGEKKPKNWHIKIYPNPAEEILLINSDIEMDNCELEFFTSDGKKLISSKFSGCEIKLNINEFPSGNYYIVLKQEMIGIFKEIVIKK